VKSPQATNVAVQFAEEVADKKFEGQSLASIGLFVSLDGLPALRSKVTMDKS